MTIMKMSTLAYISISILSILLLSKWSLSSVKAQSGRIAPKSIPQPEPPTLSEVRPKFAVNVGADKYKLLFPLGYVGKKSYRPKEKIEEEQAILSRRSNFMERLNQAGAEGYQLISATGSYPIFAIAKLDQIQHEYAWFETTSRFFFRKNDFEEKYAKLSKQGFSMADHLFIGKFCDSDPPVSYNEHGAVFDDRPENCNDIDLYLVERLKNIESPKQYRVARHSPSWKARTSDASLTEQLNDYFAAGFSPTQAFSRFEILLQQVTDEEKLAVGKLEWQVVTSPSLGNDELRKKVNEGAQQGYRLNLTQNGVAVLSRFRDSISPTTYVWLDVTKKTFLAELAQLQSKGAIYQMTYPLADGDEYVLIFELPVVNAGKLREYKTLKFELKTVENAAEKKMDINLTPSSKEAIKTLNSLANEGFEVRDLFVSDKVGTSTVNVLFERVR